MVELATQARGGTAPAYQAQVQKTLEELFVMTSLTPRDSGEPDSQAVVLAQFPEMPPKVVSKGAGFLYSFFAKACQGPSFCYQKIERLAGEVGLTADKLHQVSDLFGATQR